MNFQPRFCTNCGQPLTAAMTFCVSCGTPAAPGAPQQRPAGTPASYPPAQAPTQNDPLLTGLAAGYVASRAGRRMRQRPPRQPSSPARRARGCGCALLMLLLLVAPFVGLALTTGPVHQIFSYIAGGMVTLFLLAALIGMLATRRGREILVEGLLEGVLEALFKG